METISSRSGGQSPSTHPLRESSSAQVQSSVETERVEELAGLIFGGDACR